MQHLRLRAKMLADIRQFFAARGVLEVETPLLCRATGTDPQLDFFSSSLHFPPENPTLFLQTSPEFAMKRLLAAGSGSIYQICKAFRNGESGRSHNPEFTIIEWYRVGYTLQQLMDEVAELMRGLLADVVETLKVEQISYQRLFQEVTGLDPLVFESDVYRAYAQDIGFSEAGDLCGDEYALWLDLLFSHLIQPVMTKDTVYLVYDYPAVQSSLARIHPHDPRVVERFEVFVNGMELGNGFFELADAIEQDARFDLEMAYRQRHGLAPVEKDRRFLAALQAGLPDCSGIALGLDRLLMVAGKCQRIEDVLAFPLSNA